MDPEGKFIELFLLTAELLNSLLKLLVVLFNKQLLFLEHPLVERKFMLIICHLSFPVFNVDFERLYLI